MLSATYYFLMFCVKIARMADIKFTNFVFMRDHVHLILTPAPLVSLEKAMQFVKGGFSFRAKKELNFNREIWQKGNKERRITDTGDYAKHVEYIWMNPVKAGYVQSPEEYFYSSARLRSEVDPAPPHFHVGLEALRAKTRG